MMDFTLGPGSVDDLVASEAFPARIHPAFLAPGVRFPAVGMVQDS